MKAIAPKGTKDVYILTTRERGQNVTVIGCCDAEGMFLPQVLNTKTTILVYNTRNLF